MRRLFVVLFVLLLPSCAFAPQPALTHHYLAPYLEAHFDTPHSYYLRGL